jgi:hypothetical protein
MFVIAHVAIVLVLQHPQEVMAYAPYLCLVVLVLVVLIVTHPPVVVLPTAQYDSNVQKNLVFFHFFVLRL